MADKFFRLLRLLKLVPRAPKMIDTDQISTILSNEGVKTTMRTIQRDLVELERMGFGIECLTESKPYRWRFLATANAVLVPALDAQTALALRLAEMHLERVLPKSTLRALQPHLQAAKEALEGKPVSRWLDKVRLIPRSQPLLAPKVDGAVVGVFHEALLEGRQVQVRYASKDKTSEMPLHVLGIVHRDNLAYVIATAREYPEVRMYSMHRFLDATMLDAKARAPSGFSLEAFVAGGELGFRIGKNEIELELLFEKEAGHLLEETPLTTEQKLVKRADGTVHVTARVPETHVLRAWLLGFGAGVEVLAPKGLRDAIRDAHKAASARYA